MKPLSTANSSGAVQQRKQLYHSPRWRKLRKHYLLDDPYCVMCMSAGRLTLASVVDHKHGHGLDWEAHFWEVAGLQGLCAHCHAIKTAEEIKPDTSRPWRQGQ